MKKFVNIILNIPLLSLVLTKVCLQKIYNIVKVLFRVLECEFTLNLTVQGLDVTIEGKGKKTIGPNTRFGNHLVIASGKNSLFESSEGVRIGNNTSLYQGESSEIRLGENSKLGAYSTFYISKQFLLGENSSLANYVSVASREPNGNGVLRIGKNTGVGDGTIIDIFQDVEIGDYVAVGPNCTFYTHDHYFDKNILGAWRGGIKSAPIKIHNGAWVGCNVTIMPGVSVGENAIIAANAVVLHDVPSRSIVAGVPAKQIKKIAS